MYLAVATVLGANPLSVANASIVSEALTRMGPAYTGDDVVGVIPFVL